MVNMWWIPSEGDISVQILLAEIAVWDSLCGPVVRVPGYRPRGLEATKFSA
jgi:hypothetical protein